MSDERTYTPAEITAFYRAARQLVRFAERTGAIIYLDAGHINLMSGNSHEGIGTRPRQDRVVGHVSMGRARIGAGDW